MQKKDILNEEYEQGYFNKKIGVNTNDRWNYRFKLDYQIDNREKIIYFVCNSFYIKSGMVANISDNKYFMKNIIFDMILKSQKEEKIL